MEQVNKFILRGTIVNLNISNRVATVRLAVEGGKGITNFPVIVFFDTSLLTGFGVRQRVVIKGHTQNQMRQSPHDPKKRVTQTILVADSIIPAKRMLLDYFSEVDIPISEGGAPSDMNTVIWVGNILNIYTPDEKNTISFLRVGYKNGEIHRQCDFSCFDRIHTYVRNLELGQEVAVVGKVTTSSKEINGQTVYYQNIIAQDVFSPSLE